jgi:lysophospholipid acyltransferase (LPLAT)-like uncharacterized protein
MRPKEATPTSRLIAFLISGFIKALSLTLRYDDSQARARVNELGNQPIIVAFWHNRLALSPSLYRRLVIRRFPSHRVAALVSASRDGAMLAEILKCFQIQPVRGSSSRRGAQALKELVHWAKDGWDLAITPDGPRGPCYKIQEGVIAAAQLSGHPLLPVSYQLSSKLQTKSWDRFQIPLPFSKCTVMVGAPILVPRKMNDKERQAIKERLQRELDSITFD